MSEGGGASAPTPAQAAPTTQPAPEASPDPAAQEAPGAPHPEGQPPSPGPQPELDQLPAVTRALAPPAEMQARVREVAVIASPLLPVRELAQQDPNNRGRGEGGVDIEVPVPGGDPDPAPPVGAEELGGLPRTGMKIALLWGAGVALLAAGLAIQALTRRRPLH